DSRPIQKPPLSNIGHIAKSCAVIRSQSSLNCGNFRESNSYKIVGPCPETDPGPIGTFSGGLPSVFARSFLRFIRRAAFFCCFSRPPFFFSLFLTFSLPMLALSTRRELPLVNLHSVQATRERREHCRWPGQCSNPPRHNTGGWCRHRQRW